MEPTAEELLKQLVDYHVRVEKEDVENKAKREATERIAWYFFVALILVMAFVGGFGFGYQFGYDHARDVAIQVVGPWIRALI
jgi:nitrate reductase NapE component